MTLDARELDPRDGFDLTVTLEPDDATTPDDFDSYGAADVAAWHRGDWSYVGVVVTASRAGVELGRASIWGTEAGYSPGWDGYVDAFASGYVDDLIDEAIDEARARLAKLCPAT